MAGSGFGGGPLGQGGFGEWPWSLYTILEGIPSIYIEQDEEVADGALRAVLASMTPSLDSLRRKIRDWDRLRDPLRCPTDQEFQRDIIILKSENLDDGTSRVSISEGGDGDKFDDLRNGMVVIDDRGRRFSICQVVSSGLPGDIADPPTDPATGELTGKYLIVQNIGQSSTEFIPFVSGDLIEDENPTPVPVDDGIAEGPYVFTVAGLPIARNRVVITWLEDGEVRDGFFVNTGLPGGSLDDTSTINFATGEISVSTDGNGIIDSDTIRVDYTSEVSPIPEDSEIRSQNILAFLGADYGVNVDLNDPETLQRSFVYHAYQLWDIKGTDQGYLVNGQMSGYFVDARSLNKITDDIAAGLPADSVFEFPVGDSASGSILAVDPSLLVDGETFTLDDAVNPTKDFEYDTVPDGVTPGNEILDTSAAVTDVDVANLMVSGINSASPLNFTASNGGGTLALVTVTNTVSGEFGNVLTWSHTVADPGFVITQPTGGTEGQKFTIIDPEKAIFDEVIADVLDLDLLCAEAAFPDEAQSVTIESVTFVRQEGSRQRNVVVASTTDMELSFGTAGFLTDTNGVDFVTENFERIDSSSYRFEVSNFAVPSAIGAGAASVLWKVFKFEAPNTVTIIGIGTDVTDLGLVNPSFSGKKYRIEKTFTDPPLASVGNWRFIDSDGIVSLIEKFEDVGGGTFRFEIVSGTEPASGDAHIFYGCEIQTSCSFCRASSLLVRITPTEILNFPESLEGDSLGRLIIRLRQMVPAHVSVAAFLFGPGPAVAALAIESSSDITIVNENILEEYLEGDDPLSIGGWSASALWHVTSHDSGTGLKSFLYGQNELGRAPAGTSPDYDTGAISSGILTSPSMIVAAASVVTLRLRHFGDVLSGGADDDLKIEVVDESPLSVVRTITKTDLGLFGTDTNGGFTTVSFNITGDVVGIGSFHLEFNFGSITSTSGRTGEGWYIDDVEVQVTP